MKQLNKFSQATINRLNDRIRALVVILIAVTGTSLILTLRTQEALIPQRVARKQMDQNNAFCECELSIEYFELSTHFAVADVRSDSSDSPPTHPEAIIRVKKD